MKILNNFQQLYDSAIVDPKRISEIQDVIKNILNHKDQYMAVQSATGIPWWCVSAIHNLEASLDFSCHIHNGDPLTNRTVHYPPGRPVANPQNGKFPYMWFESAMDALAHSNLWMPPEWNLAGCLEFMERYNGLGYRLEGINSPYLWSYTNHYTKGFYDKDGHYDGNLISEEIGGAALFKMMESDKIIVF